MALSSALFTSTRAAVRHLTVVHYEKSGHLEWVYSRTGVRTLKDEFDKVASHNEHHLQQIRTALQRD